MSSARRLLGRLVVGGLLAAGVALPVMQHAKADDTCHSIGGNTSEWNDPTGWSCGHVPGPGDAAVISTADGNSYKYVDGYSVEVGSLEMDGSGVNLYAGQLTVDGQLTMDNRAQIFAESAQSNPPADDYSTLTLNGTSSLSSVSALAPFGGNGRSLVINNGTLTLHSGSFVDANYGGIFDNTGTVIGDGSAATVGVNGEFDNQGAVEAQSGDTLVSAGSSAYDQSGASWTTDSGATLEFTGARTLDDQGVTGAGTVQTDANITIPADETYSPPTTVVAGGAFNLAGTRTTPNLTVLNGGTVEPADLTVTSQASLSGGTLDGGSILRTSSGASATITGTFSEIGNSTLDLAGTTTFGPGGMISPTGGTIINEASGTFSLTGPTNQNRPISESTSGGQIGSTGAKFVNDGTVSDSYAGTLRLDVPTEQDGLLKITNGTLVVGPQPSGVSADTGRLSLAPATKGVRPAVEFYGTRVLRQGEISGTGTIYSVYPSGQLTIPGPVDDSGLTLSPSGGTITITGQPVTIGGLSIDQGVLDSDATVTTSSFVVTGSAQITGSGTTQTTAKSTANINGDLYLYGGTTFLTAGTTTVSTTQNAGVQLTGAQWTNSGTLTLHHAGDVIAEYTGGGQLGSTGATFTNTGKLIFSAAKGSSSRIAIIATNTGTISVLKGTVSFSRLALTSGTVNVAKKAVFTLDGGAALSPGTAVLTGPGTIACPVLDGGTVTAPVILSGGWTMGADSTAAVALGAKHPPVISVSKNAALAGTLAITEPAGFAPPSGARYTLISVAKKASATITGTFGTVTGVSQPYTIVYTPTAVYLQF